ncbi:microcin C ABC transporter permease YejB [Geminicoccus roseus]|uniref:microcin C ABC transporter permease YejB n=1 Tax=Geminicoccus roseus TaxID=404900 RepID=UPI0003F68CBF|nr:microcin C ABC transporter permease YejB [Geminicoccus roseus]
MLAYILKRLLLIIPTLFGILLINFVIVQAAPGGPIDLIVRQVKGEAIDATARFSGTSGGESAQRTGTDPQSRSARGLDPALLADLERQFGFDRPAPERFVKMLGDYLRFDFGNSFFRGRPVVDLIIEKMPVSISLGVWTTLITYLVSIPLGIRKAVKDGTPFDIWSSTLVSIGYAIPSFLFAVLLVVVFAGGSYLQWFPLRGLTSDDFYRMTWWQQALDYAWHLVLPVTAMVVGSFASLTLLTKNGFVEELGKQYVLTARAKGLPERRVLYGHVFRNAMLIVIAGFPSALLSMLFTGALLIEIIFSLDGLGLLSYEAAINRDYPIIFGTLFLFTLVGLLLRLISDLTYVMVDPRIDFAKVRV